MIKLAKRDPAAPLMFLKAFNLNASPATTNIEVGDIAHLRAKQQEFEAEISACNQGHYVGIVRNAATELDLPVGATVEFSMAEIFAITKR